MTGRALPGCDDTQCRPLVTTDLRGDGAACVKAAPGGNAGRVRDIALQHDPPQRRKVILPASRYPKLKRDWEMIDFSGWPIYTHATLPDQTVYDVCAAIAARDRDGSSR